MALRGITKTEITQAEYLQLLGLHLLARRHYTQIREIEEAIGEIIGDSDGDSSGDWRIEIAGESDDRAVLNFLDKAEIEIVDAEKPIDG